MLASGVAHRVVSFLVSVFVDLCGRHPQISIGSSKSNTETSKCNKLWRGNRASSSSLGSQTRPVPSRIPNSFYFTAFLDFGGSHVTLMNHLHRMPRSVPKLPFQQVISSLSTFIKHVILFFFIYLHYIMVIFFFSLIFFHHIIPLEGTSHAFLIDIGVHIRINY